MSAVPLDVDSAHEDDTSSADGGRDAAARAVRANRGILLACLVVMGTGAVAIGSALGAWYLPLAGGFLVGVVNRKSRKRFTSVAALFAVGPVAWGAVLLWAASGKAAIGASAQTVAALAGLPVVAASTITLTLLIALFMTVAGFWLACALFPRRGFGIPREAHGQ